MSDTEWQQPRSGYAELIGYRVTKRDTDYCEMELTVEPQHLNRLGVPHGGVLATLIDTTAGIAVAFAQGPDKVLPAVTVSRLWQPTGFAAIVRALPLWAQFLGAVLVADLAQYAVHRAFHRIPLLWRFHNVHHIDPDLDVSTGFRFHFGEIFFSTIFRVAQVSLIGTSFTTFAIYEVVFQVNTLFHHLVKR